MYTRSTCGGIEMRIELDKLGAGSVVKSADGVLLTKDRFGDWWKLSIQLGSSPVKKLDSAKEGTVLLEEKKGPLDDFVVGDIISFMTSGGVRVAVKTREDFWQIVGAVPEVTSQDIIGFADEDSIRKVGSLDGES